MRRIVDVVLATIAVLVLWPIMLVIMIALRLSGEGEILYSQQRVGLHGTMIRVWKFATMLKDSPHMGTGTITIKDDPRILPLGRILRRSKLDELPQLYNILRGDMSIIGPRPQTRRCFDAFPASSKPLIMSVKPGLCGIGSIVFCDEEDFILDGPNAQRIYDDVIMPYKGALEEWYVTHRSAATYSKLVILGLLVLVFIRRTTLVWRMFPDLPLPTGHLASLLGVTAEGST